MNGEKSIEHNNTSYIKKIALGTVQFGLNYGINNTSGQIETAEARKILSYAESNGIATLDTAHAYGDSEKVLGSLLQKNQFHIISKLPHCEIDAVEALFQETLERLQTNSLYGYLYHHFKTFQENRLTFEKMLSFKEKNFVRKIGFSLYHPYEVDLLIDNNIPFDLVQIPYSIFDQRFNTKLSLLKEKNVEIHVRSLFLQGLMFKKSEELSPFFESAAPHIKKLHSISIEHHISIASLCINFGLMNNSIDKIVIGVDSLENLQENVRITEEVKKVESLKNELSSLAVTDENILLPYNWK